MERVRAGNRVVGKRAPPLDTVVREMRCQHILQADTIHGRHDAPAFPHVCHKPTHPDFLQQEGRGL